MFFNRIEIKSKFNYRPQDKTISFTCTYKLKGDLMLTESVFIHMLMPLRYRSIDFYPKSVDLYINSLATYFRSSLLANLNLCYALLFSKISKMVLVNY